jgi:hypothetical protein
VVVEVKNHINNKKVKESNFKKTYPNTISKEPIWPKQFNLKSSFSPESRINLGKLVVVKEAENNLKARIINYENILPRYMG